MITLSIKGIHINGADQWLRFANSMQTLLELSGGHISFTVVDSSFTDIPYLLDVITNKNCALYLLGKFVHELKQAQDNAQGPQKLLEMKKRDGIWREVEKIDDTKDEFKFQ